MRPLRPTPVALAFAGTAVAQPATPGADTALTLPDGDYKALVALQSRVDLSDSLLGFRAFDHLGVNGLGL